MDRYVESKSRTEVFDVVPGQRVVVVRGIPITSVTTVKNATDRDFAGATAIDSSNYGVDLDTGAILFDRIGLAHGAQVLEVVYVGGMAANQAAFVTAFPDVAVLTELQIGHLMGTAFRYGSKDFELSDATHWMLGIKAALLRYRRRVVG